MSALGLRAPAVHAPRACTVPFGDGTGHFSEILREPDGRRAAPALEALRVYEGRAVLAVPGTDAVIPPEVTEAVAAALGTNARVTRLDVPGSEHRLGEWFHDHAEDRARFVDAVLDGGGPA